MSISNIPYSAWVRKVQEQRGWILLIAANLAVLTCAGIYAIQGRSGAGGFEAIPGQPAGIGLVPVGGQDRGEGRPKDVDATATGKPAAGNAPLSTSDVIARCEAAVVQIKGRFGSGSGFLVGIGLLATNAHVVGGEIPEDLRVHFPSRGDGQKGLYRATLIYEDVPRDLALLKVDVPYPPLPLASPYHFRRGEDVTIIGSPGVGGGSMTLENAVSRGVLSTEMVVLGQKYYQFGASVNPGNSGGPAIDSKGVVIGIVTLKAKEESIGFCIPVDDLTLAIDRARLATDGEVRVLARRHGLAAVFRNVVGRAVLCATALDAHSKQIEAILQQRAGPDEQVEALQSSRDRLTLGNESFDDGYRVAVSELLIDPVLPADVRRDLRDLWSTCDDMSRLALDSRPNLGSFRAVSAALLTHFGALVQRLQRDLAVETP